LIRLLLSIVLLSQGHYVMGQTRMQNAFPRLHVKGVYSKSLPQADTTGIKHIQAIPQNLYTNNLGFFCKQEIKIEKLISIPLKIRLGSLEQCNYMEQKTGYKYLNTQ